MSKAVIKISNLNKTFHSKLAGQSFYSNLINLLAKKKRKNLHVLKDIDLEINEGEFVGIVGRNGSGKSTLLKLLIGAIKPNEESEIIIKGKIMRLALGMGFDPNLSARDNIYLNGAILGLTFREIGEKFDEIIAFAELEKFVDTAVRFYSTGMKSRLTFSIAQFAKTDILLIDEFFGGVGDESFKNKSEKVFKNTFLNKKTILFVSHNLNAIQAYCTRVLYIKDGRIEMDGLPTDVIGFYKESFLNTAKSK